jgi:hypothetical protein
VKVLDDRTTLYTSLSVALEAMTSMIDNSPGRLELGYARAACVDAKKELDLWLEDGDMAHLLRGNEIIQKANAQMAKWGHRV